MCSKKQWPPNESHCFVNLNLDSPIHKFHPWVMQSLKVAIAYVLCLKISIWCNPEGVVRVSMTKNLQNINQPRLMTTKFHQIPPQGTVASSKPPRTKATWVKYMFWGNDDRRIVVGQGGEDLVQRVESSYLRMISCWVWQNCFSCSCFKTGCAKFTLLGKRKIIFKSALGWDVLISRRDTLRHVYSTQNGRAIGDLCQLHRLWLGRTTGRSVWLASKWSNTKVKQTT